jgi:short-subunit dehydrogenase
MKILKGKTALVTGASRGIGIPIAKALAARGVNLVLMARNAELLEKVSSQLKPSGVKVFTIAAEVGNTDQLPALLFSEKDTHF